MGGMASTQSVTVTLDPQAIDALTAIAAKLADIERRLDSVEQWQKDQDTIALEASEYNEP